MFTKGKRWTVAGKGKKGDKIDSASVPALPSNTSLSSNLQFANTDATAWASRGDHIPTDIGEGDNTKSLMELCQEGNETSILQHCRRNAGPLLLYINVACDAFGNTILHLSASMDDFALSCLLLLKGADPNALNKGNVTPTMIARRMGFNKLLKVMMRHGGVIPSTERQVIFSNNLKGKHGVRHQLEGALSSVESPDAFYKPSSPFEMLENRSSELPSGLRTRPTTMMGESDRRQHDSVNISYSKTESPATTPLAPGSFPQTDLPIYNAAFLGYAMEAIANAPITMLSATDYNGHTPLMKAAYKGHLNIVKALLERQVDANVVDNKANTALVWAASAGHLAVVKVLLDYPGVNVEGCSLSQAKALNAKGFQFPITSLVAAAYSGHTLVVECLLNRGAGIDRCVGSGGSRTAIMFAAWMRQTEVVKLLLARGARTDNLAAARWLKSGLLHLKRATMDYNAWSGSVGNFQRLLSLTGNQPMTASRRMSLKERVSYFSTEENQSMAAMESLITTYSATSKTEKTHASNASLNATESDNTPDSPAMAGQRTVNRGRTKNSFRQGMNFDKLIGHDPGVIAELTEHVPDRGSELDALWIQVFQFVIQLLTASNQNKKAGYILISAKAIHYAGEINRAVEAMDRAAFQKQSSTPSTASPITPASGPASGGSPDCYYSIFQHSPVRSRIKSLSKAIANDFMKQLMLTTRIAIGVWPPQHAMADMIKAATDLARSCRELIDLANLTGMFPILDKTLELNFAAYEEEEKEVAPTRPMAGLTYEEYKRQNDLKVLEEISKHTGVGASTDSLLGTSADKDARFFELLDDLVLKFVAAVKEIHSAYNNHLKDQYVNLTSTAAHTAELLIDEIKGHDLLSEFPEELTFDIEDAKLMATKGVKLGDSFPVSIADVWYSVLEEVRQTARNMTTKGKLASGVMPPPNAAMEMLQCAIPCVMSVKKLVTISKESASKIRRTTYEDQKKKERLKKDVLQNAHVKHLFALWQSQVTTTEVAPAVEAELAVNEELDFMPEDNEGLLLEEVEGSIPLIKGGKLTKLVEWMTSHLHIDKEYNAAFILTHHSLTTSLELLDLLIRRYTLTPPPALTRQQYDIYLRRKIFPVKHRVCAILKQWMESHFEGDFAQCDLLVFKLRDFVESVVTLDSEVLAKELLQRLDEKLQAAESANHPAPSPQTFMPVSPFKTNPSSPFAAGLPPPPKLPRSLNIISPEIYNVLTSSLTGFLEFDPLEMARQLAILEFEHFRKVKAHECLDQIWGERRKKELRAAGGRLTGEASKTGLAEMIRHTNVVTIWIANSIIRHETLKDRRDALKYFAQMALHCYELCNFNGITAINAAMSMAPLNRLKKTWDAFKEKYPKIHEAYEEAAAAISPKGQYANYRKALKDRQPPAVPFLGVSLTDLTFAELGNPDFIPDTAFINFDKRRKIYQILTTSIQKYQVMPYNLIPIQGVLDFFKGLDDNVESAAATASRAGRPAGVTEFLLSNEEELYDMSLRVEPREEESDEEADDM
ncbi:hypothetical protein DFS34DRAFT_462756 [Phlyctochytrium arcticum]|nr:hypothetical protein DFS34DRAFT_462756 [Phlyctochytrium arcticum]